MLRTLFLTTAAMVTSAALAAPSAAAEPSYFRIHGGVADQDKKPLPAEFETPRWRQPLPAGNSTPCVYGERLYLTSYDPENKQLATVALDRKTGAELWRREPPNNRLEEFHPVGSPASCTPACDGQRLYVFFGSFGLICYDLEGKQLWAKPMGPFQDEFGASSSPLLVDGKVILNEDHDIGSFVTAIDSATGETLWKVDRPGFTRSYSTPIVWQVDGKPQLVVAGALQLTGYDLETGKRIWWVNGLARIVNTTPVVQGGLLYVATWAPGGDESERISMEPFPDAAKQYDADGDGKIAKEELPEGAVLTRFFRIDLDQDGKLNAEEWAAHARVFELAQNSVMAVKPGGEGNITDSHVKWKYTRGLPSVPSPLVYRDTVYIVKNSGIVTALDAKTGEVLKAGRARGRGNYYASPVAGDGKIYLVSESGVVTVLSAGREWETLGSHDFGERVMATPVIDGGRIYIRTDEALYSFSASEEP